MHGVTIVASLLSRIVLAAPAQPSAR